MPKKKTPGKETDESGISGEGGYTTERLAESEVEGPRVAAHWPLQKRLEERGIKGPNRITATERICRCCGPPEEHLRKGKRVYPTTRMIRKYIPA